MELLAGIGILLGLATIIIATAEDEWRTGAIFLVIAVAMQIFWFPRFLPEQITTETIITNKHNSMEFECPVKITTIEKHKPFSIDTTTEYKVEFLKEI